MGLWEGRVGGSDPKPLSNPQLFLSLSSLSEDCPVGGLPLYPNHIPHFLQPSPMSSEIQGRTESGPRTQDDKNVPRSILFLGTMTQTISTPCSEPRPYLSSYLSCTQTSAVKRCPCRCLSPHWMDEKN